jgi:hypothetical protein
MRRPTAIIVAAACLCALAGTASSAMAAEATIDGVSIMLPAPTGFCDLTRSNPADKRGIDTIGQLVAKANGNRLLSIAADCQQLARWRDGKQLLADYAQYQTPQAPAATDEMFKQTCASLRTQGEQTFSSIKDDIKTKMEEAVESLKVNDQSFAGFLGEDSSACYVAMLQNLKAGDGQAVTQLALLAITVVKGKFLFVNRYAPYVNSDTVKDALAKHKLTIAALLAANRS